MGVQISKSSAEAPEFDDDVYTARVDSIVAEDHPEWAKDNGPYGADDGKRIAFNFTLMDGHDPKVAEPLAKEDGEDFRVNALTSTAMGKKSKFALYMKGILTPVEQAQIEAGETIDSDGVTGRFVQLVLSHKENGWPQIDAVLPPKKVK